MPSPHEQRLAEIKRVYDLLLEKGENGPPLAEGKPEVKDQKPLVAWVKNVTKATQKPAISYAEALAYSGSIHPKVVNLSLAEEKKRGLAHRGIPYTEERWVANPHKPPSPDTEKELSDRLG